MEEEYLFLFRMWSFFWGFFGWGKNLVIFSRAEQVIWAVIMFGLHFGGFQ